VVWEPVVVVEFPAHHSYKHWQLHHSARFASEVSTGPSRTSGTVLGFHRDRLLTIPRRAYGTRHCVPQHYRWTTRPLLPILIDVLVTSSSIIAMQRESATSV